MNSKRQEHLIDQVIKDSPADRAGIKPGWKLLRVDNNLVEDIIDYKIIEADESLRLLLINENGILRRKIIAKPANCSLGLRFDPPTIDSLHSCVNRCIFCFIDQNPPDMRPSLYIKDDDYRLSFLYGNFITLNRLKEADINRIIRLQLSPLYVSVHTTNPALRKKMFGNIHAERGLKNLIRLVNVGIKINTQIVLCPQYNTGKELERTINDLNSLGDNITSTALVPVGLTGHRQKLPQLSLLSSGEAERIVEQTINLQNKFLEEKGRRFLFLADEIYNLAGAHIPEDIEYEGYPQLENGVGLARLFLDELSTLEITNDYVLPEALNVTLVSGAAAESLLKELCFKMNEIKGLSLNQMTIKNQYFGDTVTVSGLLTGRDLVKQLEGKELGNAVFISKVMLRENSDQFLDNMLLSDLREKLGVPVYPVTGPDDLLKQIKTMSRNLNTKRKQDLIIE